MATALLENKELNDFCDLPAKDALEWLEKNTPHEYKNLQEFLKKHGHRVLKEVTYILRKWKQTMKTVCITFFSCRWTCGQSHMTWIVFP